MDPISEGIDDEIEAEIQDDLEIGDNADVFNNDQAAATAEMVGAPPTLPGRLRQAFPTHYETGSTQR
jgi:hypothetical protein